MSVPAPHIITCKQWKARPPRAAPIVVGQPDKIIFHHTDGHGRGSGSRLVDSRKDAIDYASVIQYDHMNVNGWNDSGHNFLVMRSGIILQGRWGTVSAIEKGRMVESAHCPGQNGNPGIEHEHMVGELLTKEQRDATVSLMAWICDRCKINPTAIYGHSVFYPTECPSNLISDIQGIRLSVAGRLNYYRERMTAEKLNLRGRHYLRKEQRG